MESHKPLENQLEKNEFIFCAPSTLIVAIVI